MDAAIWAAAIVAAVTLAGYLLNQSWTRRQRRATAYAEALAALRRWQEVPYLVLRRPASDAVTRAELGKEMSQAVSGLAYHVNLLRLDSAVVGEAYELLWRQARRTRSPNLKRAWLTPPIEQDVEMAEAPFPLPDIDAELDLCLLAMRRELSLMSRFLSRDTRRRLEMQRAWRAVADETEGDP